MKKKKKNSVQHIIVTNTLFKVPQIDLSISYFLFICKDHYVLFTLQALHKITTNRKIVYKSNNGNSITYVITYKHNFMPW